MMNNYEGPSDFFPEKYLNKDMGFGGHTMKEVARLYNKLYVRKDYDWFRGVEPNDVVVDLGAGFGGFTLHAIDRGAAKVYAFEDDEVKFNQLISNMPWGDNLNATIIPRKDGVSDNKSFLKLMEENGIDKIDFLKVDLNGGEYKVITEEHIGFLREQVKHMVVTFHVNCFREAPFEWIRAKRVLQFFVNDGYSWNAELSPINGAKVHWIDQTEARFSCDHTDIMTQGSWPIDHHKYPVEFTITVTN